MSASHTPSPAQTPTGTAGVPANIPAFMRRRQQAANPLVQKKRPLQRTAGAAAVNGKPIGKEAQARPNGFGQLPSSVPNTAAFSQQVDYVDYPIVTTKREMLAGHRTHVMRFLPNASAKVKHVNLMDEQQFVRPVKLHRRDPRTENALQWKDGPGSAAEDDKQDKMDDKERERLEILRAERKAEKEANQAQIAPVAKTVPVSKKNNFQKKTEQVFQVSDNADKKKAAQLRYEEALPWHVEDFDGKNIWAGTYESALSDCHIMLVQETEAGSTQFRMVPIEKWYKFQPKNLFKALSIDEAEARMNKKTKDPRWFMDTQKENERKQKQATLRNAGSRLFTRTGERGEKRVKDEGDDDGFEVAADVDDIDYNYEEAFADDEENILFGGDDEENKEAEEKIKREQREANVFELKEEKDYDKEEEDKKKKAEAEKKLAKRTQKSLMKREKNFVYEDDSDGNPYSSSSESEDSDAERLKEEERKKAEEAAQQEKAKAALSAPATTAEKVPSAPSSVKGSSASNRPDKKTASDPLARKGILKRPGSPNLSEASGSESSRKKLKKKHMSSSQPPTSDGASSPSANITGATISRPHSPNTTGSSRTHVRGGAGSTSDAEASDAPRRATNPLKIRLGAGGSTTSRTTSPGGSRATSPTPAAPTLPTVEEIKARIPPEGIGLQEFMKPYPHAVMAHPEFGGLIKANSRFDRTSKVLYPKEMKTSV